VFLEKLRALLTSGEYQKHDRLIERLLEEGFASTDVASALIHLLQHGEGAAAKPAKTEEYERPEREERPSFRDRDNRAPQRDEERRPSFDNRRDDRPRRFDDRLEAPRAESKFAAPLKSKPLRGKPCLPPVAKTVFPRRPNRSQPTAPKRPPKPVENFF
jgi:ATP-dependent RNA helicase DeaD